MALLSPRTGHELLMPELPANPGSGLAIRTNLRLTGRATMQWGIPWMNFWLLVLLALGTIIVAADGFSRDPMPDEGTAAPTPVLQYESFWAAYVFAGVSLPLCYFYTRKTGASRGEAILLWFVLDTVAYSKDFAYIRVPGLPLFVTDIVLAVFLWKLLWRQGIRFLRFDRWWSRLVLAYVAVGTVSVARGVAGHQEVTLVARDAAIVVYALFTFVGFHLVTTWDGVRRFFIALALGSIFATLNGLAWFLAQPGQRRYIPYGVFLLVSSVGTVILTINRMIRPMLGWLLAALLLLGILLINARTIFVELVFALLIMMIASSSGKLRLSVRSLRLLAGVTVVLFLLVWAAAQTRTGSTFVERAEIELVSGTLNYSDDPNATFRLMAWFEAFQRFTESPILGEAYGIPFKFDLDESDARPHNTYLTVLYKMGVVGLTPLVLLLAGFHWSGWSNLRRLHLASEGVVLYALLIGQLLMCLFGVLNLLLESPFLASIFWLTIGVGFRMICAPAVIDRSQFATS
jgi:O-antigen ligase